MRCSNAENSMYEMGDLIDVWDDIKGVEFEVDITMKNKNMPDTMWFKMQNLDLFR